jgi:hypothetical protein
MPRKAYIDDLEKLKSNSAIDGISHVRREDDGEFHFRLHVSDDDPDVEIVGLITPGILSSTTLGEKIPANANKILLIILRIIHINSFLLTKTHLPTLPRRLKGYHL